MRFEETQAYERSGKPKQEVVAAKQLTSFRVVAVGTATLCEWLQHQGVRIIEQWSHTLRRCGTDF